MLSGSECPYCGGGCPGRPTTDEAARAAAALKKMPKLLRVFRGMGARPSTVDEAAEKKGMHVFVNLLRLDDMKLAVRTDGGWGLTELGRRVLERLEAEERLAELPKALP